MKLFYYFLFYFLVCNTTNNALHIPHKNIYESSKKVQLTFCIPSEPYASNKNRLEKSQNQELGCINSSLETYQSTPLLITYYPANNPQLPVELWQKIINFYLDNHTTSESQPSLEHYALFFTKKNINLNLIPILEHHTLYECLKLRAIASWWKKEIDTHLKSNGFPITFNNLEKGIKLERKSNNPFSVAFLSAHFPLKNERVKKMFQATCWDRFHYNWQKDISSHFFNSTLYWLLETLKLKDCQGNYIIDTNILARSCSVEEPDIISTLIETTFNFLQEAYKHQCNYISSKLYSWDCKYCTATLSSTYENVKIINKNKHIFYLFIKHLIYDRNIAYCRPTVLHKLTQYQLYANTVFDSKDQTYSMMTSCSNDYAIISSIIQDLEKIVRKETWFPQEINIDLFWPRAQARSICYQDDLFFEQLKFNSN